MVIYGTSAAQHLRTEPLPEGTACPSCRRANGLRSSVFTRYSHVYWVPFFPIGKLSATGCDFCNQSWEDKALPAELKAPVQAIKRQTKVPYLHWTGVGLLLALALVGVFFYTKDQRANKAYLSSPQAGDVYTVRVGTDTVSNRATYSLMQVRSVRGNSVELVNNEYQINSSNALHELNKPENYGKEPVFLSLYDLQLMQQKGELTDVDRP